LSRIAFVVARDRHGVIGKDGHLPWRLPDDMRNVRKLTVGKPLIMGRRTFESIGRPLPDRTSIVLTRDPDFRCDGCLVARTTDEALTLAGDVEFLPRADRIYLTEVDTEAPGDTYFPPLDPRDWREIERITHPADARHPFAFTFVTLERVR